MTNKPYIFKFKRNDDSLLSLTGTESDGLKEQVGGIFHTEYGRGRGNK